MIAIILSNIFNWLGIRHEEAKGQFDLFRSEGKTLPSSRKEPMATGIFAIIRADVASVGFLSMHQSTRMIG